MNLSESFFVVQNIIGIMHLGINMKRRKRNERCEVCGEPATCHIYKKDRIVHLCIEHYREKEVKK